MHALALAASVLVAATAAPVDLTKVLLTPAQVGKGYLAYQRQDTFGVKAAPTLDLCGRKGYPSEQKRVDRLQVNYLKVKESIGLSNEVVRYKSGGAKQALKEVLQHARTCPSTAIATGEPGVGKLRFTITPLRDTKLVKGAVAVKVRAVGKLTNGKKVDQTSYAVYQVVGDVLSGVYSFGPNTGAQQAFALHAAEQSAKVLKRQVDAPSGPTA
jgi:hypothetical protein